MERITHKQIVELHDRMHQLHKDIKGFYRFDVNELTKDFRKGIQTPVLMMESSSTQLYTQNNISHFNGRDISFLILDFAGKADDYDKHEEVLDSTESICLDLASLLVYFGKDRTHWLYGLIDVNTIKIEKVGPIFDNMYGWNVLYSFKNRQPMCLDPDKWTEPLPK